MYNRICTLRSPQCGEKECLEELDVVLHIPYLEISDRDKMSSTFTYFQVIFDGARRVFAIEVFPSQK